MAQDKKEGGGGGGGGFSFFGGKKKEGGGKEGHSGGISGALFGKHEQASPYHMSDLSNQINNLSRRLKMLEERYTNLRNKTQLTDQNMLEFNKETKRNMKATNDELMEVRKDFEDLKEKVKLIVKELKETAKSEDVQMLEKYVNMWEPVNFVTKHDVERIVEDKLEQMGVGPKGGKAESKADRQKS
ncbi:MAG: hypothetical protein R6U32_02465 [Candidatus Woesearchaeota archaeon]